VASSDPRWHAEALLDAEEARNFYAARSPFAARGFLLELADAVNAALTNPTWYPRGRANTRRYVFPGRFPYTLVYRLDGDDIEFVAVAHHGRNPDYWLHR